MKYEYFGDSLIEITKIRDLSLFKELFHNYHFDKIKQTLVSLFFKNMIIMYFLQHQTKAFLSEL